MDRVLKDWSRTTSSRPQHNLAQHRPIELAMTTTFWNFYSSACCSLKSPLHLGTFHYSHSSLLSFHEILCGNLVFLLAMMPWPFAISNAPPKASAYPLSTTPASTLASDLHTELLVNTCPITSTGILTVSLTLPDMLLLVDAGGVVIVLSCCSISTIFVSSSGSTYCLDQSWHREIVLSPLQHFCVESCQNQQFQLY